MQSAVAFLLVSTLTTTGLVALWAATSHWHWFLRTAAFLAALSPLLLIPAYEPSIALTLEGVTIAAGVQLARRWRRRRSISQRAGSSSNPANSASLTPATPSISNAQPREKLIPRFSLSTLLLAMVLCGAGAAIAARTPALNWYAWQSVVLIGIFSGVAILLGAWTATRRGWRKAPAFGAACFLAIVLGIVLIQSDWFVPGIYEGGSWPPSPSSALYIPGDENASADWLVAMLALVAIATFMTWLFLLATSGGGSEWVRRIAGVIVAASAPIVAAFAVVVLYAMLTPEPIPHVTLPVPNAYDEFAAAGQSLEHAIANSSNFDSDTAPRQQIEQAVAEAAAAVARGRQAFSQKCVVPVDYLSDSKLLTVLTMRWLSRGFSVTARLAEMDGDWDAALAAQLDIVRLGVTACRGGLLIDGMVGGSIAGVGQHKIFEIADHLSAQQCRMAIEQLRQFELSREPYEEFALRDRIWSQHSYGWMARLYLAVDDIHNFEQRTLGELWFPEGYEGPFVMHDVESRMLVAHLALRAYQAERGGLPATWDEVEAAGLPALGVDPWDPRGVPMRYRRDGDRAVIYSVGQNRVDEGGAAPSEYADPSMAGMGDPATGDLLMEEVFH